MLKILKQQKADHEKKLEAEREVEDEKRQQQQFMQLGITPEVVEQTSIPDSAALLTIKNAFRTKFQSLITNILKIALTNDEEKLSCLITAYYEVALEEDIILKALSSQWYQWLMFVWAFDKNYIGSRIKEDSSYINFEQLFDLIKKQHELFPEDQIKNIK
mmetsp:Transcript_39182/g.37575  ORF Transcript_39182/g.37575 Transcript_39182/m.37575 type:complete len:160 (+) Transcript_39182:813-1292(+)